MKHDFSSFKARAFIALVCYILWLAISAHADDGPFALSFDGINDYVSAPHSTFFNNSQLTVTAWIKTTQTTGEVGVINKYVAGSLNGWNVFLFNGEVRAWYFGDSGNYIWDGGHGLNGGFVANNQWRHIAFTVGLDGGRLYVDGLLRSTNVWTGTPRTATTTQELRLGSYPGSGFYRGLIDEVTVWSKTLSFVEVDTIRSNSLIGTEVELRGYYRLTEGTGTVAGNSGYATAVFDATLVNG